MDKKELLDFIKNSGHAVTEEAEDAAGQLLEILEAQKQNLEDITAVLEWLEKKRKAYKVNVCEVGMKDLDKWRVHPETGHIFHETGKFFSVVGVKVEGAEGREVVSWTQPMIKQEECGILGILCKKINGVMHYLLYAKYEPGTIAGLQLSPTLQATESNLRQAHGGKKPLFAKYFEGGASTGSAQGSKGRRVVNVVEVEDPGRFYHKTNRCMIVEVPEGEEVDVPEDYIWLTLPQIKKLLALDNTVNSLARCVFGSR
ncbi:MAG: NDP-hexose 2,3-dehydratase family protein [bacterium]|nr:NDP-hexose 2,3-dehydratase family protein [bacterium]